MRPKEARIVDEETKEARTPLPTWDQDEQSKQELQMKFTCDRGKLAPAARAREPGMGRISEE